MKESKTEFLIQENSKISDVIGTVKSAESIKITPNSFSIVKCKYKSNVTLDFFISNLGFCLEFGLLNSETEIGTEVA